MTKQDKAHAMQVVKAYESALLALRDAWRRHPEGRRHYEEVARRIKAQQAPLIALVTTK